MEDEIRAELTSTSVSTPFTDEEIEMMSLAAARVAVDDAAEVTTIAESPISADEEQMLNAIIEEAHKEIPENSKTALISDTTSRFSDAIWYNKIQEQTVMIAGIGGIGSYVAFLIARMKPQGIILYDDDIVESANMSGQLYGQSDLGTAKVTAITKMIGNYANFHTIYAFEAKYTSECEPTGIMICGFDNMSARKTYFESWLKHLETISPNEKDKCLFIDGRLAAEEFQILAIQGNDERAIKEYKEKWLFTDSQADATICSYKQTTFCANMIGSMIVNIFVNFIANQCNPLIPRDVPFLTTFDASTMYFKTEA